MSQVSPSAGRKHSKGYKLLRMILQRPRTLVVLSLVVVASCRKDETATVDSALPVSLPAPVIAPPVVNTEWDESVAGPVLLIAAPDNSARALVVLPMATDSIDSSLMASERDSLSGLNVELFDRSGLAGSTTLVIDSIRPGAECLAWPSARLSEGSDKPWRTGFARGVVVPLRLDSLEAMSSGDSSLIVRELARISSSVAEGDDPTFSGLPFIVRRAYRLELGKTTAILGDVVRKIGEEANPREEHLLIVAEKPVTGSSYSGVFHSRAAGTEDAVRTSEILGAVRFVKDNTVAIVISFEYESGGRFALLKRLNDRAWTIKWRSAYTGC
jgi:hypothetical protein